MPDSPSPDLLDRMARGWRAYVIVALISLAAGLPGVFRLPVLDRDEARFAQASAQMLERGDFVRIAVQDEPRNKKPIGIYWLQSAAVSLFSKPEAREIWAYRLVSAAGALLAAWSCLWGGTALVGRRAALLGAGLLGACVLLSTEAMIAKTDATLCGFTTLAMGALARLRQTDSAARNVGARSLGLRTLAGEDAGGLYALLFWAAIAFGILIKGPVTPMVAGLCLATLWFWEKRAAWMKPLVHPAGPLIAALIVLPWFIAIGAATNGKFFADAVGGDLGRKVVGGDEGHGGPPGYHLLLLPLLSFPIAIGLPAAARVAWRAIKAPRQDDVSAAMRFLIAWAAPTWIVFELLPTKLVHYPLPAYPALALLAGAGLVTAYEQDWKKLRLGGALLYLLGVVVLGGICAYASTYMPGDAGAGSRRAIQTALVMAVFFIPLLALLVSARRPALAAAAGVAASIVFAVTARERILPEARTLFVSQEASDALMRAGLHPRLHPNGPRLTSVGYNEPSFIFLTRTDTVLAKGNDAPRVAFPGQAVIVEGRERETFERSLAVRNWAFAPAGPPVEGLDYSNGDRVSLQPGRVLRIAGETPPSPPPEAPPPQ
ncbi:MAG TPA: glycosyltransferase family 39 protein [Caulobacterales bacterium]|nr:glycosyltransferase family 39 protein [Caulobacterales bacterium]